MKRVWAWVVADVRGDHIPVGRKTQDAQRLKAVRITAIGIVGLLVGLVLQAAESASWPSVVVTFGVLIIVGGLGGLILRRRR